MHTGRRQDRSCPSCPSSVKYNCDKVDIICIMSVTDSSI